MCMCVSMCVNIYRYTYIYICSCIYKFRFICIHVFHICIYLCRVHRQAHIHTNVHTLTHTHHTHKRQTGRERWRHTFTHKQARIVSVSPTHINAPCIIMSSGARTENDLYVTQYSVLPINTYIYIIVWLPVPRRECDLSLLSTRTDVLSRLESESMRFKTAGHFWRLRYKSSRGFDDTNRYTYGSLQIYETWVHTSMVCVNKDPLRQAKKHVTEVWKQRLPTLWPGYHSTYVPFGAPGSDAAPRPLESDHWPEDVSRARET